MTLGICPAKTKGNPPKKDQSTQQRATKHTFFGVNMVVLRFKESTKYSEKEENPHRTQDADKYFGIFLINEGNDKWYNQECSLNKQELGNKKTDNRSIHGSLPLQQVVNMSYIL